MLPESKDSKLKQLAVLTNGQVVDSELFELDGCDVETVAKLHWMGIHTFEALSVLTLRDAIADILKEGKYEKGLTEERYEKVHMAARNMVGREITFKPFEPNVKLETIPTGSKALDELLDGGYQVGESTELCAPYSAGKTNSCMTASVMCWDRFKAPTMYVHTEKNQPEPVFAKRVMDIARARGIDYPANKADPNVPGAQFNYCGVLTTSDQEWAVRSCDTWMKKSKCKLFIVDSMMSLYRKEYGGRETMPDRQRKINRMLNQLTQISNFFKCAVIVTNQWVLDPDPFGARMKPAGGPIMQYGVGKILIFRFAKGGAKSPKGTTIMEKSINDDGLREVILTKSLSHPVDTRFIRITSKGTSDVGDKDKPTKEGSEEDAEE